MFSRLVETLRFSLVFSVLVVFMQQQLLLGRTRQQRAAAAAFAVAQREQRRERWRRCCSSSFWESSICCWSSSSSSSTCSVLLDTTTTAARTPTPSLSSHVLLGSVKGFLWPAAAAAAKQRGQLDSIRKQQQAIVCGGGWRDQEGTLKSNLQKKIAKTIMASLFLLISLNSAR